MDAINTVRRAGSIAGAVQSGIIPDGIMHALVTYGVPFILAGSIRDDGPLPGVITDVVEAQDKMRMFTQGATLVVMLATMLHSIATGNMLPTYIERDGKLEIDPTSAVGIWLDMNKPTDEEIREGLSGNFCRCTGYQNIVEAVKLATSA